MAKPVKVWLPAFMRFCELVRITSKEADGPVPIIPYEGQKRFLRALTAGLENDTHHFTVLKSRQLGISTILLALDIFWLYMHPGLQGALITDTSDNKETMRATITEMLESLPPRYRVPIKTHNRNALVLQNGSRLQYMSAGKQKNSGLGRSRALNFVHATECSSWGDQKGLDSLRHSLAQENPNRLYVFESTALGFNIFYDMWEEAKGDSRQKAIFIGWWSKDYQKIERDDPDFARWWADSPWLTEEEKRDAEIVKTEYGWDITEEQWAWYRRGFAGASDEASWREEQPTHEYEAFQATGNTFFNMRKVQQDIEVISKAGGGYTGYNYTLGNNFLKMRLNPTNDPDSVELKVWEDPIEAAKYVMGVDPAYGRDDTKDRSCITVWRCYADKLVQVAEFATPIPTSRQVAWVMCHLAGCYRDCVINLEVTGPGSVVLNELDNLRAQMNFGNLVDLKPSLNPGFALDQARWYLYSRPDTMGGGGYFYGWKTNFENKQRLCYKMRDCYDIEELIIRSIFMLNEMTTFVQDNGKLHASGRNKDDRVMSGALAVTAWHEWVRPGLMVQGMTYASEMAKEQAKSLRGGSVVEWIVPLHWENQRRIREEAELQRLLEGY